MKIGFIFECGPDGPDEKVCSHLVNKLDSRIEVVSQTLDNKKNLIENCGEVTKLLLNECAKVIIVWDLYPVWRERRPCRYEDRQAIYNSLRVEDVNLNKVFLVCIREELEAWLLADRRAVSAVLNPLKHPHPVGRLTNFSKPDNIRNPKKVLTKIFNLELGNSYKYNENYHAIQIAREIPDFQRIKRSESFNRFAYKVAGIRL